MSDDLKKRLRDTPNWMREGFQDWKDNVRTYDRAPFEAADRIEELEAKLEKAMEALADVYRLHLRRGPAWDHEGTKEVMDSAITTLAELTGGKDE